MESNIRRLPGESFIREFNPATMRFEQFDHFGLTTTRQSEVTRKLFPTVDNAWFAKSGQPHGLRAVKLRVLKC
jgi:hypothetical protein